MAEPSQFQVSGANYAAVWGIKLTIDGTVSPTTGIGIPTGKIQGFDWSKEPGINDTYKNPDTGATELVVIGDTIRRLELNIIPSSSTLNKAKLHNIVPAMFDEVTLASTGEIKTEGPPNVAETDVAGKYRVLSASKTGSPTSPRSIRMSLIRYEDDLVAVS